MYQNDYPRPQLCREDWQNLNGEWDFCFDDENIGKVENWQNVFPDERWSIVVPFTYETELSTINRKEPHDIVWYHRKIDVEKSEGERIILHFEGSDYLTEVWINGIKVGNHQGGYSRFSFDITDECRNGMNSLTVRVSDSFNLAQPRGKQRWEKENFACWYTQTTGIWKTVWLETVAESHIRGIKITPVFDKDQVEIEYDLDIVNRKKDRYGKAGDVFLETEISYKGKKIRTSRMLCDTDNGKKTVFKTTLDIATMIAQDWGTYAWTPENPNLYDVRVELIRGDEYLDSVKSYFGMRKIEARDGMILLNNRPIYERLILDQGYWRESGLTPPSTQALLEDITKIKEMGFNGLRKHMKIEDERFLYLCDREGMLVWSEMPATYVFCDEAIDNFTKEWIDIVRQNVSHPCIVTWTPINESWGVKNILTDEKQQAFTKMLYELTKSLDGTRPVVVNDGWEHTVSDILTLHDYEEYGEIFRKRYENKEAIVGNAIAFQKDKFAFANGFEYKGQPVLISEYGGIAFSGGGEGDWGYGNTVADEQAFLKRLDGITSAIVDLPYACGFCYTQVSDVEQEINGLLDADHEYKIAPEKIRKIICG